MRYWILLAVFALAMLATTTASADTHELELELKSPPEILRKPGESQDVHFMVRNNGDVTELLEYDFSGDGWAYIFFNTPSELEPGEESGLVSLRLTAPEAPAGELTLATMTVSNATTATTATFKLNLTVGWRTGAEFSGPHSINAADGLAGYAQFQLNSTSNGAQPLIFWAISGEAWQWRIQPTTWDLEAGGSMAVALDWLPPRGTFAETVGSVILAARTGSSTIAEWHFEITIAPRNELALDANSTLNIEAGKRVAVPFTIFNHGNRPLLAQVTAEVPAGWDYLGANVGAAPASGAGGVLRLTVPREAHGLTTITLHARTVDTNLTVNLTIELMVRPPPEEGANWLPYIAVGLVAAIGALVLLGGRRRRRATGPEATDDEMVVDDGGDEWEDTESPATAPEGQRRASDGTGDEADDRTGDGADDDADTGTPEDEAAGPCDEVQVETETSRTRDDESSESAFDEPLAKAQRRPSGLVRPVRLKCPGCDRRISVTRSNDEQMTECLWCSATVVVRRKSRE